MTRRLGLCVLTAWAAVGCVAEPAHRVDDDSEASDDDAAGDDDSTTGDDDSTTGDDDSTTGDDDSTTGDDDATPCMDLDCDGITDFVIANALDQDGAWDATGGVALGHSWVYLGVEPPAPLASYTVPTGRGAGVAAGDLDGDGFQDVVFATHADEQGSEAGPHQSLVYWGSGASGLQEDPSFLRSWAPVQVAVGDVDGDGRVDVVIGAQAVDYASVWLNDGGRDFGDEDVQLPATNTGGVAIGDVDGDGNADVVLGSNVGVDNGSQVFGGPLGGASPGYQWNDQFGKAFASSVVVVDLDSDGHNDIVSGGNQTGVWWGRGKSRQAPVSWSTLADADGHELPLGRTENLCVADLDGDGSLDVVVGHHYEGGDGFVAGQAVIAWGPISISGASSHVTYLESFGATGCAVGDFDDDGDLDLVMTGYQDGTDYDVDSHVYRGPLGKVEEVEPSQSLETVGSYAAVAVPSP